MSFVESVKQLPGVVKGAGICALLGFVISLSSSSSSTVNGTTVSCSHFDLAAVFFGGMAIVLGGAGLRTDTFGVANTVPRIVSGVSIAVGVLHLLRGFGVIFGPC